MNLSQNILRTFELIAINIWACHS